MIINSLIADIESNNWKSKTLKAEFILEKNNPMYLIHRVKKSIIAS